VWNIEERDSSFSCISTRVSFELAGDHCAIVANLGGLEDEQIGLVVPPEEFREKANAGLSFQYRLDLGEDGLALLPH